MVVEQLAEVPPLRAEPGGEAEAFVRRLAGDNGPARVGLVRLRSRASSRAPACRRCSAAPAPSTRPTSPTNTSSVAQMERGAAFMALEALRVACRGAFDRTHGSAEREAARRIAAQSRQRRASGRTDFCLRGKSEASEPAAPRAARAPPRLVRQRASPLGSAPDRRVADGVEHVAHEAVAADALDRALGEERAEGRVVQRGELGQRRAAAAPSRACSAVSRPSCGELVPGADRQAVVAAVDAVAERGAVALRDRPGVLDGQVREAGARIELIGRREGVRRADVEAGAARAAVVLARPRRARAPAWSARRPGRARSRTRARPGWCACPASRCPAASASGFSIRGAVSTNTFTSPPSRAWIQLGQPLQPPLDQVVIVVALGVDRDRGARPRLQRLPADRGPARSSGPARSPSGRRATSPAGGRGARRSPPSSPSSPWRPAATNSASRAPAGQGASTLAKPQASNPSAAAPRRGSSASGRLRSRGRHSGRRARGPASGRPAAAGKQGRDLSFMYQVLHRRERRARGCRRNSRAPRCAPRRRSRPGSAAGRPASRAPASSFSM